MGRLIPTNRENDCPVCGDISGNCRSSTDDANYFQCLTNSGSAKFEIVNGFKHIGPTKDGLWGQFVVEGGQPQKSFEERQQLRLAREAKAKRTYQAGLSASKRHAAHTALLNQLYLQDEDKADLERRGLSAAAITAFRSIESNQQLSIPINSKTPGVGFSGKKLLTPHSGYLVPAYDLDGNTTGFQIRNRSGGRPKYPWLSVSNVSPVHLRNGEIPLTYAPGGDCTTIYLAEGILKPIVAAERLGISVIGASGGLFASSSQQLAQWLSRLKPAALVLCPDGGDLINPHVIQRLKNQYELFEEMGCSPQVFWYGQAAKTDGDIDEISREQFNSAQLISFAEFLAMVPEDETTPAQPEEKPQTKADWLKAQKVERDRKAYEKIAAMLTIEANVDTSDAEYKARARAIFYEPLKQHLKYETRGKIITGFATEMQPNTDARSLIVYDCSQGTGKSNNALIPPALRVAQAGGRVLIIVPTRGLAKEFKGRINERAGEEIAATHLDSNYYSAAIVVSCPESVYKFKGQRFELIQIDEANEVLHRIESAELGNAGPQSLATFRNLIAAAPTVTIATAAMSGWTLAAVQTIGGFTPEETQVQRRSRPATEMKIVKYNDFHHWLHKSIECLRSGQRIAIPTGSRGKGRMIDRVLRALFPDKNGLVIDGAATLQNQRSQFLADPDAFLATAQPDWFIFTPVINSGVSIEGQHFDVEFEYISPHEGAQSISQRGERIRSAIGRDLAISERHIYISDCGTPTLEAYPDAFDWQYWANELADESSAPIGAAAALAKALGAEKALNPLKQETEKFTAMRPHLPHFMALKAFEIIFRKELLNEDWTRYGWEVTSAPALDGEQGQQRQQLQTFCEKVQIGLIEQQGRTLKKTKTRESEGELDEISNPFQAARAAKLNLERFLGKDYLSQQGNDFFTAWGADKSANNPGVRAVVRSQLLQMAIADPECWHQIERMKALKFLAGKPEADTSDSNPFWSLPALPATARDIEMTSIMARCPGVAEVVSGKLARWTNADPQIVAGGMYLISHTQQIAANTKRAGLRKGAKFSGKMAPTALFNKALELMGYKPSKEKREGSGARLNIYRLEVTADAVAALKQVEQRNEKGMSLFRAELRVIRAQSRHSIDAAARNRIVEKALEWVTEKAAADVKSAISAIRRRHADSIEKRLTKLGDASILDAERLLKSPTQMALLSTKLASLPPPLLNGQPKEHVLPQLDSIF